MSLVGEIVSTRVLVPIYGDVRYLENVQYLANFASVRLIPSNTDSLLGRMQYYEYRLSMQMRRIAPWMVSGACHIARTHVHQEIMRRHSLFFQGNDVEAGILASALGYNVGHIPFDVPTTGCDGLSRTH